MYRGGYVFGRTLNPVQFSDAQKKGAKSQELKSSRYSPRLEPVPHLLSHDRVCDTSTRTPRPLVTEKLRHVVFDYLHGIAHPDIRATQ